MFGQKAPSAIRRDIIAKQICLLSCYSLPIFMSSVARLASVLVSQSHLILH